MRWEMAESSPECRLYLCLPNQARTVIAELHQAYEISLEQFYGGVDRLQFRLPYRVLRSMKFERYIGVNLVNGDYLVKWVCGDVVDYFIITRYRNTYDDGQETMDVECQGLAYELSYKVVLRYKETRQLYDANATDYFLKDTLLEMTDWTVDQVDALAGIKYRSLDVSQLDLLSFLQELANTYDLVLKFDNVNKTVSFLKEESYGIDEGLVIDEQYLRSLTESDNHTEIVTKLIPYGANDLTVARYSATATNAVVNYSFYLYPYEEDALGNVVRSSYYLSDGICKNLLLYQKKVEEVEKDIKELIVEREGYVTQLYGSEKDGSKAGLVFELNVLKIALKSIEAEIDVRMKNKESVTDKNAERDAKKAEIALKESEISNKEQEIANTDAQIEAKRAELAWSKFLTEDEIKELNRFTREQVWVDTRYVDEEDLYVDAKKRLARLCQPTLAYEVDCVDLLRQLNQPDLWSRLKLGSIVTVRFADFGISALPPRQAVEDFSNIREVKQVKAKVIELRHDVDRNDLRLVIANVRDIRSGLWKLSDLLNNTVKTGASFAFNKSNWDQGSIANSKIEHVITSAWDATKNEVLSGNKNVVRIDERGITNVDPEKPDKYLRITNSVIAMTDDGGATFKTGITADGIVAENLTGVLATAVKLNAAQAVIGSVITGGNDEYSIDDLVNTKKVYQGVKINGDDGIIVESTITTTDNIVKKTNILINANKGIKIDTIVDNTTTTVFHADTAGNLTLKGTLTSGNSSFKLEGDIGSNATIRGGAFQTLPNSVNKYYFRLDDKGLGTYWVDTDDQNKEVRNGMFILNDGEYTSAFEFVYKNQTYFRIIGTTGRDADGNLYSCIMQPVVGTMIISGSILFDGTWDFGWKDKDGNDTGSKVKNVKATDGWDFSKATVTGLDVPARFS